MGRIVALVLAASLVVVPASLARASDDVITITSGPSGETTATSATFEFASGRSAGVAYTNCTLDGAAEERCSSPVSYAGLSLGAHRFAVLAYGSRGDQIGSDARSWTIVSGPPPPPPPPPAPVPVAKLVLTSPVVPPGGMLGLDASGSTGPVAEVGFDLDGNGSYETTCESGKAGAVFSQVGSYVVGVQAISASGQKSVAKQTVAIAGAPAIPPSGAASASPPQGTIVGSCLNDAWEESLEPFLCPKTVVVGVAEATVPPKATSCFAFTKVGSSIRYVLEPSVGYAMVNGVWIWPKVGKLQVDATTKHIRMIGTGTVEIYKLGYSISLSTKASTFAWSVAKAGVVGELHFTSPVLKFLGLSVPADLKRPLVFTNDKTAKLDIAVAAPSWFESIAGSSLSLRMDNQEGLHIDNFVVKLGGFSLGPFGIKDATVAYTREGTFDVWSGGLTVAVPGGIEAGGQVRFRNGSLDYLKLFMEKNNPGWPIGCCVFLTYLSGETDTSYLKASAGLSAGPSLDTPWGTFRFASVDPASVKVSLGAGSLEAEGTFKVVGKEIGGAYFAYFPSLGFIYFHGALNKSFSVAGVKVIEVGVLVQGSMKSSGSWYAGGSGSICVLQIDCAGGHLAVSNKGVSACISAGISVGGYIRWNGDWDYFWACSWSKVKAESGAAVLRALSVAGAARVDVRVAPGTPRKLFRVAGRGSPPRLLVEGPGGRRIEASAEYARTSGHFVLQVPHENATYVAVLNPAPGRWRFTALRGSAPIAGIGSAGPLPSRMVRGTLRAAGYERVLRYAIDAPKGFTVSFFERGKDFERPLGRAAGKAGELRFTPAESGPRARRVEAVVESDGLAVRTEVTARFAAPPLRPLPAPRLALTRRGTTVVARWLPVARAGGYRVAVSPGDGAGRSFEVGPRQTTVRVPGIGLRAGAVATVRALSGEGRPGRVARARLTAEPSVRVLSASRASVVIRCLAAGDGVCAATATAGGKSIGSASVRLAYGRAGVLRLRLRPVTASAVRLVVEVPGEGARTTAVRIR